jgi:hypothetical protein
MARLDVAKGSEYMNLPGWGLRFPKRENERSVVCVSKWELEGCVSVQGNRC